MKWVWDKVICEKVKRKGEAKIELIFTLFSPL